MNTLGHDDAFPSGLHFSGGEWFAELHSSIGSLTGNKIHLALVPVSAMYERPSLEEHKSVFGMHIFNPGVQSPRHFHPRVEMLGACARRRAI